MVNFYCFTNHQEVERSLTYQCSPEFGKSQGNFTMVPTRSRAFKSPIFNQNTTLDDSCRVGLTPLFCTLASQ
jgi:hypothetical protein